MKPVAVAILSFVAWPIIALTGFLFLVLLGVVGWILIPLLAFVAAREEADALEEPMSFRTSQVDCRLASLNSKRFPGNDST